MAISARRHDSLDVASGRITVVAADVTDRAGLDAAAEQVRDELGQIDMVTFNAGFRQQTDAAVWTATCSPGTSKSTCSD